MVESLEKIIAKEKNDINSHLTKEGSEILNVLTYFSNDDINYLKHLINENKRKNGGLPTGEIIFKNIDIPFDLIFRNFPYLKNNYEDALKEQNPKDKDNKFEKANNKLINCILFLINGIRKSENKVQINGQNSNIENFNIENFKSLLSSRDNVAYQIYRIRLNSNNNLTGNIELRRGVSIDLSDNKFTTIINEYQQAYIKSKDEKTKAKLDTKLAERLILEEGLIIQINNPLLSLHDSNYKDKRKLATNLRACKQGLENIGISTNAIKITHNGEMFYAVEKKDSTKKTKEENEILGKPTINDIYTDSGEGKEKLKELIESGILLVDFGDGKQFKNFSDINPDMRELRKKTHFKDKDGNIYILDIWDEDTSRKKVRGPYETEPADYYYHFKRIETEGPTETETETETTTETETEIETTTETETEIETTTETETETETTTETETETETNETGGDETDETGGDETDNITIDAALSDSTEVYTDHVGRNIDEALNRFYNKFSWKSNFTKKLQFFLFRGYIKNKKVKERLDVMKRTPFTLNKDYDSEMANLVNRHDLEEKAFGDTERGVFGKIERTNLLTEKPELQTELKNLCKLYILGNIDESSFKNKFNEFVKNSFSLPKDKQFVSTNILDKLNQYRNNVELLINMGKELKSYQNDNNNIHFENIKKWVVDVINSYTKNERFKKDLESLYKDISSNNNLEERIGSFIKHQEALTKMSIDNMQLKLDMLSGGKGAYQINNKDNEDVFYKLGDWLDNHRFLGPLVSAGAVFGVGVTAGIFLGLPAGVLGSAVVGAKLAVKKKTHATKEQHNQEGQISTDSERALKTIKEYERILTTNDGEIINTLPELTKNRKNFKYSESEDYVTGKNGKKHKIKYNLATRYRALRQIQLYRDSIQSKLLEDDSDTKNIITIINSFNKSDGAANNNMKYFILDSYARLEAYLQTGHNFFKSKNSKEIETDFYNLELCLNSAAEKLFGPGKTFRDIKDLEAEDKDGNQIVFDDLVKGYISDYQTAKNKFKKEKRELSLKYFIGGTLTSAGISHLLGGITDNLFDNNPTGTLGEPEVHEKIIENFDSGSFILPDGNEILDNAINDFQDLTNNDVVTLHFGSGTDIRPVRPDSILTKPETYLGKLQELTNLINESSFSNKEDLINQVSGWNNGFNTAGQRFTNDILHDCRCLDVVINTIKGANTDHFDGVLNLHYDIELDNPGTKLGEQFRTGAGKLEIRHFIPGEEGGKWTKYFRPLGSLISVFSNTFTRKPEEDDKPKKAGSTSVYQSPIIVPHVKSDERAGTNKNTSKKEEEQENTTEKEEVVTEKLKKDVRDFLYGSRFKYLLNEERYRTIRKNDRKLELVENAWDEWEARFKDSPRASARLEEAKNFRKRFPKINFYDKGVVNSLKEEFKENSYVLEHIDHEINNLNGLNPEFKHYLEKSEIDKYRDKAKSLVESAISEGSYGDMDHEMIIIKVSDDLTIPFYVSDGTGGKLGVPVDRFYPIFGIGPGGRLNKGHESEINNYYGSPLLAAIAKELNKRYDDKDINPHDRKKDFSQEFKDKANKGKKPVDGGRYYNNINETLKKLAKIEDSE